MSRLKHTAAFLAAVATVVTLVAVVILVSRPATESTTSPTAAAPNSAAPTSESPLLEAFDRAYRLAVPGADTTAWADMVTYSIGGRPTRQVVRDSVDRPDAWLACPDGDTTYEGRACPVSLSGTLQVADDEGDVVVEPEAAAVVGCTKMRPPVAGRGMRSVTIRPDTDHRDCFADFAVTLYLDDTDQVAVVDLALSSP